MEESKFSMGEIYKLTSKTSGKSYIGKANKYISGHSEWGSEGRRKSHVREALNGGKDHCVALNNAIRKYGEDDFNLEIIHDNVPIKNLNKIESESILEHGTMVPNGYNIKNDYMQEIKKTDKNHKKTIVVRRQYPEDKELPPFIVPRRDGGYITAYKIIFPIPESDEKVKKEFTRKTIAESLQAALQYLEELKTKYKFSEQNIDIVILDKKKPTIVNENSKDMTPEQKKLRYSKNKREKIREKLPEFIGCEFDENDRITSYFVEGYKDHNGNPYPRKDFNDCTRNTKNLAGARRYIKELDVKNKDAVFEEYIPDTLKNKGDGFSYKRSPESKKLPKYISIIRLNGKKIGYAINNFPLGKEIKKEKFCDTHKTLEEKYNDAIKCLEKLWAEHDLI